MRDEDRVRFLNEEFVFYRQRAKNRVVGDQIQMKAICEKIQMMSGGALRMRNGRFVLLAVRRCNRGLRKRGPVSPCGFLQYIFLDIQIII